MFSNNELLVYQRVEETERNHAILQLLSFNSTIGLSPGKIAIPRRRKHSCSRLIIRSLPEAVESKSQSQLVGVSEYIVDYYLSICLYTYIYILIYICIHKYIHPI